MFQRFHQSFYQNNNSHTSQQPARYRLSIKSAIIGSAMTAALVLAGCSPAQSTQDGSPVGSDSQDISLLNVSYDVSRDFYKDYNTLFSETYQAEYLGSNVKINQSHGGSSKQALSVANGLQADVVTFNQNTDMNLLVEQGLVKSDWQQAFPNKAVPYSSTMVLLVRSGNPKQIKDWQDLARSNVEVVMPNPKTSGTARYAFLGAYGYGLHHFNESATLTGANTAPKTDAYIKNLLANVITYDNGARAATTSFIQRGMGDVLVTTENEAHLVASKYAKGQVEMVYPSYSITIDNPVAVVNAVTDKNGHGKAAHTYLKGLWDAPAQELMASMYLRPSDATILAAHRDTLPEIDTFDPVTVFGSWDQIMGSFFVDGGIFDQLARPPQS